MQRRDYSDTRFFGQKHRSDSAMSLDHIVVGKIKFATLTVQTPQVSGHGDTDIHDIRSGEVGVKVKLICPPPQARNQGGCLSRQRLLQWSQPATRRICCRQRERPLTGY